MKRWAAFWIDSMSERTLAELSRRTTTVTGVRRAVKKLSSCGTPCSSTLKSSGLNPETKRPPGSVTSTSRATALTSTG
jgi:hypothetical protein